MIEAFKTVDPEITLPSMLAFLYAVERDGQAGNQDSITQRLDMSGATASRAIGHWLTFKRPGQPGLNFMESEIDPADRRYRLLSLNRRGLAFVDKIKEFVNGASNG
ncbi:MAG TPA: hypothetical protein PLI43_09950 [Albidovulum sp.]|uniref:hypothetical protein n=1 Tax=Albidovulum sp. TaxID=1872424 RepID=UPI002BE39B4E|nr:hypothetical protein [Albidovulum sp.]